METYQFMVCTRCLTYNHAPYITDTMQGFCMQNTSFPVVYCILDDASTDGEQDVIKSFLQNHFTLKDDIAYTKETEDYQLMFARHNTNKYCYFAVLFLKYNHKSINKDKRPYYDKWVNVSKYIAVCEGDDYWTHPQKLQMQVDYMESHNDISMCSHGYTIVTEDKTTICDIHVKSCDTLLDTGRVIENVEKPQLATLLYKASIMKHYPDFFENLSVGDYPLRVYAAITGGIYYFDSCLSCYRSFSSSSWTKKMLTNSKEYVTHIDKLITFAQKLDTYTDGLYHDSIVRRIDMCRCLKYLNTKKIYDAIKTEYFKNLSKKAKLQILFRHTTPLMWYYFTKIHMMLSQK